MYELTGIGSENFDSFSFLMPGHSYLDYDICIGAVEDGEAAGVALYNAVENALMLDYIYVAEKFRRRGIASAILNDFLEEIDDAGAVAVHINFPEFARDIYHFVVAQKFKIFRDGKAYVLPVEKLLNSARLKKLFQNPQKNRVVELSELTRFERSVLIRKLDSQEMEEDIINDSSLSKELSLVTIDAAENVPSACILCRKDRLNIAIIYLVNFSKDPFQLVDLMRVLTDRIKKKDYTDNDLVFVTMDDYMRKLPETLLGGDEILESRGDVISAIRMIEHTKETKK